MSTNYDAQMHKHILESNGWNVEYIPMPNDVTVWKITTPDGKILTVDNVTGNFNSDMQVWQHIYHNGLTILREINN